MRKLNFRAELTNYRRRVEIWAIDDDGGDKIGVAQPAVFVARDALEHINAAEPAPLLSMPVSSAQVLIDALWDCGMRPTEGSGSAGSLAATERHLKDLQEIVRVTLNAALPGAVE